MMKRIVTISLSLAAICLFLRPAVSQQYIADYSVAKESVLRGIPVEYINKARSDLVIAYQHTSHGTHVSRGVFGLPDYKRGDDVIFGVATSNWSGRLEFRDYALSDYAPDGVDGSDLSRDETAFIQTTRNYLDAPENADVNVVMWSWCSITGHNVTGNYLPGMTTLIGEYGPEGSKIGTGEGQREKPVTFIFMTGHAEKNANTGNLKPKAQAAAIIEYCNNNEQFCLDYYSIDTHDMDDHYYEDTGDNGDSDSYGGNFYLDWQNSHSLGVDYFENKSSPGGAVEFGAHNTQHITANRKAYAFWWILARIAGWEGEGTSVQLEHSSNGFLLYPNPGNGIIHLETDNLNIDRVQVINMAGQEIQNSIITTTGSPIIIDISNQHPGFYGCRLFYQHEVVYNTPFVVTQK